MTLKQGTQFFLVTLALTAVLVGLLALVVYRLREDVNKWQVESIENYINRSLPQEMRQTTDQ